MEGAQGRVQRLRSLLLAVLFIVIAISLPARADLGIENELTYIADTANGQAVFVTDLTLVNNTPDETSGGVVTQFYYDQIELFVPEEATGIVATSGSRNLSFEVTAPSPEDDAEGLVRLSISLGRRLFYHQQMEVRVVYGVDGHQPRTESLFRVNPAYFSIPVTAWGDPGKVDVHVVVPLGWEVTFEGDSLVLSGESGPTTTYSAVDIQDVDGFFVHVTGTDDNRLESLDLQVEGIELVLRSWPGDDFWKQQVSGALETGLPFLLDLIGLEWVADTPLVLSESAEVTRSGYGGWYLVDENKIEIGEWVDAALVLHEVSHVWINGDLFERRWITEGLAEEFSIRAAAGAGLIDESDFRPRGAPPAHPAIPYLNAWTVDGALEIDDIDELDEYETYGYETSFWVVQELTEDIGIQLMAEVLKAAANDLIAYVGEPEPELAQGVDTWYRFLDLLEEVGGSTVASDLFATYVTDRDLMDREEARAIYDAVEAKAEAWKLPYAIRRPMADWDFGRAVELLGRADDFLDRVGRIESSFDALGLDLPTDLEEGFELAEEDLDEPSALASQIEDAADAVIRAKAAIDAEHGFFEWFGLIDDDVAAEYDEAVSALDAGGYTKAETESSEVIEIVESAHGEGVVLVAVGGGLAACAIGGAVLLRRRRPTGPDGPPEPGVMSD